MYILWKSFNLYDDKLGFKIKISSNGKICKQGFPFSKEPGAIARGAMKPSAAAAWTISIIMLCPFIII